jgi:hypothetical protein
MKHLKSIILILLAAVLLFTTVQCNNDCNDDNDNKLKLEDSSSFGADLIKTIVVGLAKGAASEIGGDAMGKMLDLLGWGDPDDDGDKEELDEMNGKLDTIINMLDNIWNFLGGLLLQLKILEADILKEVNNPTDALDEIDTYHTELIQIAKGKRPGQVDQQDILDLAGYIEDGLRIENDVNGIFRAICPLTIASTPILNNYTNLVYDTMRAGNGTFTDAYLGLELYTSQLVMNQLKGVNLVVEAMNLDDDDTSATTYLDWYNGILTEEIDNPSNGASFMYNVYRLALANIDLTPDDEQTFFSEEIHSSLARALFYRHISLYSDQPLGLQFLLFTTQDADHLAPDYLLARSDSYTTVRLWRHEITTVIDVPGKVYDHWDDNHLSPSTLYNVYIYTPDWRGTPPGDYHIETPDSHYIDAYATVETYDSNYTKTDDGEINYGCAVKFLRTPVNRADPDDAHWTSDHLTSDGTVHVSGHAYDLPIKIRGELFSTWAYDKYEGWAQLRHYFYYDGDEDRTVYVDFGVNVSAYAIYDTPGTTGETSADFHVSVWDTTDNKRVGGLEGKKEIQNYKDTGKYKVSFDETIRDTVTFTAKPGHHYRTYYYEHVTGYGYPDSHSAVSTHYVEYEYFRFE